MRKSSFGGGAELHQDDGQFRPGQAAHRPHGLGGILSALFQRYLEVLQRLPRSPNAGSVLSAGRAGA
jgi:hypothetical protein